MEIDTTVIAICVQFEIAFNLSYSKALHLRDHFTHVSLNVSYIYGTCQFFRFKFLKFLISFLENPRKINCDGMG